jgi:hypothetical protein
MLLVEPNDAMVDPTIGPIATPIIRKAGPIEAA